MLLDDELRRLEAQQLATLVLSSKTAETALHEWRLLMRAVSARCVEVGIQSNESNESKEARIGIWRLDEECGVATYVRDEEQQADWRLWADRRTFSPKPVAFRVVLLGESVARGYLCDPILTPAKLLEDCLCKSLDRNIEVIDLARTDLSASELMHLLAQVPALQPDVIVIFAGNNWNLGNRCGDNELIAPEDWIAMSSLTRSHGLAGLQEYFSCQIITRAVSRVMGGAESAKALSGAQVVCVIPEFNLLDWRDDVVDYSVEKLPSQRENIYLSDLYCQADQAHRNNDIVSALKYLRRARDCLFGLPTYCTPRCPSLLQQYLRDAAHAAGFLVVDLPQLFSKSGLLPNRDLFLDYCHLTPKGMGVVVDSIAEQICHSRNWPLDNSSAIPICSPTMCAYDAACVNFMAAIHNAHHGQSESVVTRHCKDALVADPAVAELMLAYIATQFGPSPNWLAPAFPHLIDTTLIKRYFWPVDPLFDDKFADIVLVRSILATFNALSIAYTFRLKTFLSERAVTAEGCDLLSFECRAASYRDRAEDTAFFIALRPRSQFLLVSDTQQDIRLRSILRLPKSVQFRQCSLALNGILLSHFELSHHWSDFEFTVSKDTLLCGINVLELSWPPFQSDQSVFDRDVAAARLLRQELPQPFVEFGHIYVLRANPSS